MTYIYELNDVLPGSGVGGVGLSDDLGGGGSGSSDLGMGGRLGSSSSSASRGAQYWGDPDVEIEPEFLGLSAAEIWEEIRKGGDDSSSSEDEGVVGVGGGGEDIDGLSPGFMMD